MNYIKKFLLKTLSFLNDKYDSVITKTSWFDIVNQVDTAKYIDREKLYDSIDSPNKFHMRRYVPTDQKQLSKALEELIRIDKSVLNDTFVDYGCGKGKVLIFAEKMGFNNIVGIEFSKSLYEICSRNVEKTKSNKIYLLCKDATQYEPPEDIRTFYFYDPFEPFVVEKALRKIQDSIKKNPRDSYIVYVDPRNIGQLNPDEYELLFNDPGPANPFHIYKIII